ncbi:hypothetical protein ACWDY4_34265 [Streptomyces olivaceoviridis]
MIGVACQPDTLSPLLGYGEDGASKTFDGLLARDADLTVVRVVTVIDDVEG